MIYKISWQHLSDRILASYCRLSVCDTEHYGLVHGVESCTIVLLGCHFLFTFAAGCTVQPQHTAQTTAKISVSEIAVGSVATPGVAFSAVRFCSDSKRRMICLPSDSYALCNFSENIIFYCIIHIRLVPHHFFA